MSHVYHTIPMDDAGMSHETFLPRAIIGAILGAFTAILSAVKSGSVWALLSADSLQQFLGNLGLIVSFLAGTVYAVMNMYFWIQIQQAVTARKLADIAAGTAADKVATQVADQVAVAVRLHSDDEMPVYVPPALPRDTTKSYQPPRKGGNMRDEQK